MRPARRSSRWLPLAPCLAVLLLCGCGRKAAPRAPEDVEPQTITDLKAIDTAEGIQLSWSRPQKYRDGTSMPDLGGFRVERAGGDDPRAPFERLVILDVTDRDRFRQLKNFRYVDQATSVGTRYRYQVVSFTLDRYFSAPSNVVTLEHTAVDAKPHAPLPTPQR